MCALHTDTVMKLKWMLEFLTSKGKMGYRDTHGVQNALWQDWTNSSWGKSIVLFCLSFPKIAKPHHTTLLIKSSHTVKVDHKSWRPPEVFVKVQVSCQPFPFCWIKCNASIGEVKPTKSRNRRCSVFTSHLWNIVERLNSGFDRPSVHVARTC